jgi:hypothetical protein
MPVEKSRLKAIIGWNPATEFERKRRPVTRERIN